MSYARSGFVTAGKRPLLRDSFPMQLYQKAKRLGAWDPNEIDLSRDRQMYVTLPLSLRNCFASDLIQFHGGEEAVVVDLLPLVQAVADEGRIEEEMYLTTFLYEEAKHVEYFERVLRTVCRRDPERLQTFLPDSYKRLFCDELPNATGILRGDPSPRNQLRASITYNMIIEGVLAETAYFAADYQVELTNGNYFPGHYEAIKRLRQDESRHIAYGVYLISRILAEHPELWSEAERHMAAMKTLAFTYLHDKLRALIEMNGGDMPHGGDPKRLLDFAEGQYGKRLRRIARARNLSLAQVDAEAAEAALDAP